MCMVLLIMLSMTHATVLLVFCLHFVSCLLAAQVCLDVISSESSKMTAKLILACGCCSPSWAACCGCHMSSFNEHVLPCFS